MYDGKTKGDIGMERTINVTGKGRIKVKPDLIRLLISMKGEFSDYEQTLQQSAEQTEELKKIFEDLGFQKTDLKTLYFNVDTQYENYQAQDKSWKHRFKGYQFTHSINGFKGYYAYILGKCCVLESAVYGNATYVIPKDNWEILSQKTKKELLDEDKVLAKIEHTANWEENVRNKFGKLGMSH